MRKLVIMEHIDDNYISRLKEMAPEWQIVCSKDAETCFPHLADAEVLLGWNAAAGKECLKPGTALRWVHCWSAGVNTMPLAELKERNILLTNSSGVHSYPISETVFAMMLSLTRKLHKYIRHQTKAEWKPERSSLEMHGKTLGILGVGEIGLEVARLGRAFGMKVLGYRRSGRPAPEVDTMYAYEKEGLDEILCQSDYIVNALPLTSETNRLIGAKELGMMKQTSFYINIGRGETTDMDALVQALQENRIAGAGLDVFDQEPLPAESPLWGLENVIITPHVSGLTTHYTERVLDIFIPNFKDYLEGKLPSLNRIDPDQGY